MQFAGPHTGFAFKLIFGNEKAKEEWEAHGAARVILQDQHEIVTATRKQSWQEGKQEVARSMRPKSYEPNLIAELTGLSLEEVEQL